jgi:membrane associated rhomboid family serine protease
MPSRSNGTGDLLARLPLVSVSIAALSLLVCLVVQLGFASPLAEGRLLVRQAIEFVITHPALEVNPRLIPAVQYALPSFEGNEMFAFLRDGEETADQSELDTLAFRALETLDGHPYRVLGLVPASGPTYSFLTHPFIHGGWIHTLLTCLLLLAAGPLLEVAWGRRLFGATCAASALFGALVFRIVHADLDRALVGGGALVSGLVAAALVRFWKEEVDVGGWLAPVTDLELRIPSWGLGAGWGVYQLALLFAAKGGLPGGLHNAQGLTASLAGAAAGAGLAVVYARMGLEASPGSRPEAGAASRAVAAGHFDMEKVQRARAKGDVESAFQMLLGEARRSARNRDLVLMLWEVAVDCNRCDAAAPAMLQLIREELRRGAMDAAVSHWRKLGERVPSALLDPGTLLKLVPLIRSKHGDDTAVLALHQAVDPANRGFTPELGAEIARAAASVEPDVALKAANRALQTKTIAPALAAELNALVAKLRPALEEDEMGALPSVPTVKFDDVDEHDRSEFGAVADLSADPEPPPPPKQAAPAAAAKPPAPPAAPAADPVAAKPAQPVVAAPVESVAPASAPVADELSEDELAAVLAADPTLDPDPALDAQPEPVAAAEPDQDFAEMEPESDLADAPVPEPEPEPEPEAEPVAPTPAVAAGAPPPAAVAAAASAEPALFPSARVADAVPLALGVEDLLIYVSGKGQSRLAYGRVKAVSLAAVRGLGPKPVVLVDLLLSGPDPGPEPLLVVRLRSDQYDPRKLVASSAGALEALLALVEDLLKRTRGRPLPDAAAGRGRPLRMFDSLAAYASEVLRVASAA